MPLASRNIGAEVCACALGTATSPIKASTTTPILTPQRDRISGQRVPTMLPVGQAVQFRSALLATSAGAALAFVHGLHPTGGNGATLGAHRADGIRRASASPLQRGADLRA